MTPEQRLLIGLGLHELSVEMARSGIGKKLSGVRV